MGSSLGIIKQVRENFQTFFSSDLIFSSGVSSFLASNPGDPVPRVAYNELTS